ncbi:MAG TPA: ABC transporter substrate-binding protein [Casimicrobiaceae bacterium]|jgi:ABC-type transport system substrate-binding protein|nr:ABC transporter substrate-binding protein [Casimicrobiaceae bacterium]
MFGRFAPLVRGFVASLALCVACAAAAAADPAKVYRIAFPTAETGFDPAKVSDLYSNEVNEAIFDRLLTYDWLARPAKIVPMVAESMPEVSADGKVYTFHLRKGVYFADDPAFKGKKRELVAQDFVYSFERIADPANRSPWAFIFEGRVVGLDEAVAAAKKSGRFDYDAPIAGLTAVDRYTLRITLTRTDYMFLYAAAHTTLCAVAREVIEAYANDTMAHPVGTGPYVLKEWVRGSRIVLEANPGFRGFTWDFAPSTQDADWDHKVIAEMKGKAMPQIGRVEISIMDEDQSRWLAFQQQQLDTLNVPLGFIAKGISPDGKLLPDLAAKKIELFRGNDLDVTYSTFNFKDPVIGGYTPEKIALRRAIIMGYRDDEERRIVRKGQMRYIAMPVPPGVVGYDPNYVAVDHYDPVLANALLDHFGYRKGADGWRTLPDGKPLVIHYATGSSAIEREFSELWKRSMDDLGLRIEFDIAKFADHLKAAKACHLMMWGAAWIADWPDADNFMQLLYGPNTGQSNNGCYQSPAFDKLYEASTHLPTDSTERMKLFLDMARQMQVDGAWQVSGSRLRNQLLWPWVLGYKKHPILQAEWVYMDMAPRS